jgi:ribonucleoside-diphosphate reductase alpha subunit
MQVVKRNGCLQEVQFDKVTTRLRTLCAMTPVISGIDIPRVAQHACASMYDKISTETLDHITADSSVALATEHPGYSQLAARILVSNLQKQTNADVRAVYEPLKNENISGNMWNIVDTYSDKLNDMLDFSRDFLFDYFGFKTMCKAYLMEGERPQHMYLRVAIGIWGTNLDRVRETYEALSLHKFTHASPTLFNAGTKSPQLASCFLLGIHEDSLDTIFETMHKAASISKFGGGIGMHVHSVRSKGSLIRSTNGKSDGLVPMLKVANEVFRYVNQSGRRKGSCAIYLEPHHADIMSVLELKRNQGDEHLRARDLFYAMWISDLFMERVESGGTWSLFDPNTAPGLEDVYGKDYQRLYTEYEAKGLAIRQLPAQDVWFAILRSQIETGVPYMLYKDSVNEKSNQKNLGTIKSSNLCTEIVQFTAPDEISVCNLASLSLPSFVTDGGYDYKGLHAATKILTRNLNEVIDITFYPVPEASNSNLKHRPIGLGVQGLADTFFKMRLPFDSPEAADINTKIFATIYHAAVETSCDIAEERQSAIGLGLLQGDATYSSFKGSPASQGVLQPDLWGIVPDPMYDWDALRQRVRTTGMRNSLLVAPMPTASTGQLLGNTECFEPITSNLYARTTLAGTFTVVNKYLMHDLITMGLWTPEMKQQLIVHEGSVQTLDIPDELKRLYKTAYEMSMKTLINMAADRGPYIDQSMSLNMFVAEPTFRKLSSMHFYAWKKGLKTGMYYLRSKAASNATKITVVEALGNVEEECVMCSG